MVVEIFLSLLIIALGAIFIVVPFGSAPALNSVKMITRYI